MVKTRFDSLGVAYFGKDNAGTSYYKASTGTTTPSSYYFHSDHLGSASLITDGAGHLNQHLAYIPYGEVFVNQCATSFDSRFKFTGKEMDDETGLYYFSQRYLDPKKPGFISSDDLREKHPNIGSYVYCASNPINLIDPDGNDWYQNEKTGAVYCNTNLGKNDAGKGGMTGEGWKWFGGNDMFASETKTGQKYNTDVQLILANGGTPTNYNLSLIPTGGELMLNGGGDAEKFMSGFGYESKPTQIIEYSNQTTVKAFLPRGKSLDFKYGNGVQINEKYQYFKSGTEEIGRSNYGPYLYKFDPIFGSERVERKQLNYSDNGYLKFANGFVNFISALNGSHDYTNKPKIYKSVKLYPGGVGLLDKFIHYGGK